MDMSAPAPQCTGQPRSDYPPPATAWSTVVILLIFYMLAYLDRQILSLMAIPIAKDLALDDVQIGLLNGFSFVLLYAFAGFFMGWLVDQYKRRLIIFAGVAVWSISCIGCGLATSFSSLFLTRIGVGMAEATLIPAVYSMLRDLFPPTRLALANAIFIMGGSLGIGISFAAGGILIALVATGEGVAIAGMLLQPWQIAFILAGLPGVFLAFLIFAVPEPKRLAAPAVRQGIVAPLFAFLAERPKALTAHLVGTSLSAMCSYSVFAWAPLFLGRKFHMSTLSIGLGMGVAVGLVAMTGSVVAGVIVDRAVRRGVLDASFRAMAAALCVGALACCLAFTIAPSPLAFLALLSVSGFAAGFNGALTPSSLQMLAPAHLRGQMGAAYLLVSSLLGAGLGPLLIGVVTEHVLGDPMQVGTSVALVVGSGGLIGALLLWTGRHAYRHAVIARLAA